MTPNDISGSTIVREQVRTRPNPLNRLRILIVEDDYLLAGDMASALRQLGAEVIGPARSAARALELVDSSSVDLAVLDINLSGELVFSVAERLAEQGTPFVFST